MLLTNQVQCLLCSLFLTSHPFFFICSFLPTAITMKPIPELLWPSWLVELSNRLEDIFSLTRQQLGCSSVKVSWLTSWRMQSSKHHMHQYPIPFRSGGIVVNEIALSFPSVLGRAEERVAKLVDSPDRPESEASYKLDEGGWADVW